MILKLNVSYQALCIYVYVCALYKTNDSTEQRLNAQFKAASNLICVIKFRKRSTILNFCVGVCPAQSNFPFFIRKLKWVINIQHIFGFICSILGNGAINLTSWKKKKRTPWKLDTKWYSLKLLNAKMNRKYHGFSVLLWKGWYFFWYFMFFPKQEEIFTYFSFINVEN